MEIWVMVANHINEKSTWNAFVRSCKLLNTIGEKLEKEKRTLLFRPEIVQKHNLCAVLPPSVSDDADAGYDIGSLWNNMITQQLYICIDNTHLSAVWIFRSELGTNPIYYRLYK